jgi:ubiquinone/menaquinone biosynthesis C-methylase UbiE
MATQETDQAISQHYGQVDQAATILNALKAAGKNTEHLTPDDLAPLDQFHIRGKDATLDLVRLAGIQSSMSVLDIGGGMGGPARVLATETSCQVTVLDLTEEFCRTGTILTERTGLRDHVHFQHGSALDMPFADGRFDVAWTQHSTMNIPDKARLYAEAFRVLRSGGHLAFHEIMAGPVQPIHFPVLWARDPAISFLQSPDETHALLLGTGFREVVWQDTTDLSIRWFEERIAQMQGNQPPPLGLHTLFGPDFGLMFGNILRSLREQRLKVIQAVFVRD